MIINPADVALLLHCRVFLRLNVSAQINVHILTNWMLKQICAKILINISENVK